MSDMELQRLLREIHEFEEPQSPEVVAELFALKEKYNALVDRQAEETMLPNRDMMEALPDSVWIEIIREALPRLGYIEALLTLTMVSERWMKEIASVPTLWSRIEFCPNCGDFESSLETFVYLSRSCAIDLVLYAPFPEDSPTLITLVGRIHARLRNIIWTSDSHYPLSLLPEGCLTSYLPFYSSRMTFHLFKDVSSIKSFTIYLTGTRSWTSSRPPRVISDSTAPPNLQNLTGWALYEEDFQASSLLVRRLHSLECLLSLDRLVEILGAEARPNALFLNSAYFQSRAPLTQKEVVASLQPLERWSKVTNFTYRIGFTDYLLPFLAIIGPTLSNLDIRIPYSKIDHFITVLEDFCKLKVLEIKLEPWEASDRGFNNASYSSIPDRGSDVGKLRQLSLAFEKDSNNEDQAYNSSAPPIIFGYFARTYLQVESAIFYLGHDQLLQPMCDYVTNLTTLRDLAIQDRGFALWDQPRSAQLNVTENTPYLQMPILRTLYLTCRTNFREGGVLTSVDTKHLTFMVYNDGDSIKFSQGSFPSLTEICLRVKSYAAVTKGSFELISFPNLTTFHLSAAYTGNNFATRLCFQLYTQPQLCPKLSDLRFAGALPEWDILVMMLETRNFLPGSGISKIRKMTLPYMPEWMRPILQNLLRGQLIERPNIERFSFKGAQDVCFDPKIAGCYTCLRYILGPCDEPALPATVIETDDGFISMDFYLDNMILDCTQLLTAELPASPWITRRAQLFEEWKQQKKQWSEKYSRNLKCKRREVDTEVCISEHDQIRHGEFLEAI